MAASPDNSIAHIASDEDQLFEFVVRTGHGVKGLVDAGISHIPNRYIHPPEKLADFKRISSTITLPIIDLSGLSDASIKNSIAQEICEATKKFGFFHVINYGVPQDLVKRLMDSTSEFFELPPEKKACYLKGVSPCKNVFLGTSFTPESEKCLEWKDYIIMFFFGEDEARAFWPPEYRDVLLEYLKLQQPLISFIFESLLKGIGVTVDDELIKAYIEPKAVNLNYYPVCPNPELTVGVGPHSDLGVITLLVQDDVGGLQAKIEDEWVEIAPMPGALIVNVGATLEILSNGEYKSVEHMARASNTNRISIPIFVGPRPHTKIGPLPGLLQKDGKPIYKDLLFGELMEHFFSTPHKGKQTPLDFARF
ncbi:hypothetical protein AMTRI_Chr09g34300 [Amborella trichopoda]|uniref:Fe2OG dioxygenase domain-containing protein n=1 Tax=Amborella trichopoda TaxID=13333 RepID=W1NK65_AMBTC|nr:feruloyl CoA ortho-hydroxylase 2 [Amborella trichopoda]ERM96172.1 hypothetical protein AMTR_s00001p00072200 [Amborella trichopoda]|eukprot:XP_006828756.1 feruloyl CoA ortho-hydroxylase 2 [Amborella trichopoda]